MVKQTKSQRLREKMRTGIKYSKQTTLGSPTEGRKVGPSKARMEEIKKQIEITQITTSTREDELEMKLGFRLGPSRTFFSRLKADLFFDEHKIDSLNLRVLQGLLATDESEFSAVLNMSSTSKGKHTLRVEMSELWDSGEKLYWTSKEATIDYVPVKTEDGLIKIPTIKRTAGADLDIVTDAQRNIYREIEKDMREESEG